MTASKPYDLATAARDYPAWAGPPARTVLICTHPRSGSTLLGEALYFAGDLGCPLEYYHVGFRPRLEQEWGVRDTTDYTLAMWRRRTAPSGVLSIKLMWRDVQELALEHDPVTFREIESAPPEAVSDNTYALLAKLLREFLPSPTCVHLYRRDRVRQAVSATIATQTGQWRAIPGAEMSRKQEPHYDRKTLTRLIGYSDFCHGHWRKLIAAMNAPSLSLTYEDINRDYTGSVAGLLTALGSTGSPPPVRMRRQADELSEAFVLRYLQEQGVRFAS
ncbi:MAG TPA: Stf0 family sulfotransferase [Caulobacteraceae bacterium]